MDTSLVLSRKMTRIKGSYFFGNTLDFLKDPLHFLMDALHRGERMVQIRIVYQDCYLVFQAEDVKYVLQENYKNYTKSDAYEAIRLFLGNGLVTSEGEFWRRQRKLAQPAFYKQRLARLAEQMNRSSRAMLDQWETLAKDQGAYVDVSEEMMKLTLEIVSESLFSADVKKHLDHISDSLAIIIQFAYESIVSYVKIPLSVPTPRNLRYRKAVQRIEQIVFEILESRKDAREGEHLDLLGMLSEAKDEETGEKMTPQQLRDEVTTIFMAGHETTANAMSWALYLLACHPEITEKIRREVQTVVGEGGDATFENLSQLKYTLQVIQEVLRLYPPGWIIGRKTIQPDTVCGFELPAHAPVIISPYAIHRNPLYWQNPDAFDPDHFLPERIRERPTFAYLPFGGGPRQCIGNNFALMEMQIILALIVQRFDLRLPPGQLEIKPEPSITLRPRQPITLQLAKRT